MKLGEWVKFWRSLTWEQQEEIRAKARWEHRSLMAVAIEWFPELMKEAKHD